jgi:hypothetical protein
VAELGRFGNAKQPGRRDRGGPGILE